MSANFNKAKKEFGIAEYGRWLLPDGEFLNLDGNDDHRIIGICCKNDWREFIKDGAMSLHYDSHSGYFWIRTSGITLSQMITMRNVIDDFEMDIRELKVDFYDFESWDKYSVKEILIDDSELAKLYLTDQIAYNCSVDYFESE